LKGNSADHPLRQSHQHNDKQQQAESTADTANSQAKATHDEKEQQQQHEHGQEQQQTEHDQQNGRAQHNGGTREEPNEQQNEQQGEAHGQKDAHHEKEKVQKPDERPGQHEVNMNQKEDGKQHDGHHMEGNARADGYLTSQNQEHNDGDIKHEHQRKLMQVKDDDSAEKNEQSDDFDFDHLPDDELDAAHDLDDDFEHGGFDLSDMSDLSDERLFDLDEFDDGSNALFEDDIFPFLFDDDDDSMSIEDLWLNEIGGDEEQEEHDIVNNRIGVDPHVLANGAIGDIDGDGVDDLVVPVSYFFDEDYYQKPENRRKLRGVDPQLFLATGVVVYTHDQIFNDWTIKWKAHLDLTTANASRKAYALSPPTLADLDGDGMLEIVVGTSVGFVYALNPSDGSTMEHYPLQLGEVQAQVTVEDMDDDGALDLVVCDMDGVVAAFTGNSGSKLWERHMGSPIAQAASIGDVTGSGKLDVVVSTTAGGVHILNGGSGTSVFHTRTAGSIVSPPLLTQLNSSSSGLHVVVPSFDGFVYTFDGTNSSKRDVVDLGERSLAMPLTHDLDGDGLLDIVVATMSGTVFSIETLVRTSPLMSVKSQAPEGVPLVARPNWRGLYALTTQSRGWRDIFGKRAAFPFTIVDRSKSKQTVNFTVSAFMMSNEDGASGQMVRSYSTSGRKIAVVDVPPVRGAGSLELRMKDAAGRRFSDSLDVTFHTSHYRILKWIVTAAMGLGMLGIFHATREQGGESLPG
jgi:outer membrane protein assembly factor BamB